MNVKIWMLLMVVNLDCGNTRDSDVSIVGEATNMKAGAVVLTKDSIFYFVDGLTSWDSQYFGKKVKITGKLFIENNTKDRDENGGLMQTTVGAKKIIKAPKIQLTQ